MKTHTIRWNGKNKTHKIVTFSKELEKELLLVHPQAASIFIFKFLDQLRLLTGQNHNLDYTQKERLNSIWINNNNIISYEQNLIDKWIQNGIRILDTDLITILKALDLAYKRLFDPL
jgi:hypothetical protein